MFALNPNSYRRENPENTFSGSMPPPNLEMELPITYPAVAKPAFDTMMTMGKIDVAAIKKFSGG
jgi:hypothetical protein